MALKIYDTLAPQGDYPAVKAESVEMPDGSRLSDFKGGVTSVNGIKPDENGNVTIETEIPVFDLAAMGLPTIEVDGLSSNVNADLTEIGAALAAGPVKLLVKTNFEGTEETTTYVGTGFYKPNDYTWQVISRMHYNDKMITGVINFIVPLNKINALSFTAQEAVTDAYINNLIDAYLSEALGGDY